MRRLEQYWYKLAPLHLLLWPLSVLFMLAAALRRLLYRQGWRKVKSSGKPVVVIGNITVGGTGKTPLVIWLAAALRSNGRQPGIVCRGYGGATRAPHPVLPDSDTAQMGDEAVLLARRCACPVWAGVDRPAAQLALLAADSKIDIVLSDDGLQHYAMHRDLEIAVLDGQRGVGNGLALPAGPLREPVHRLKDVDAIVINGQPLFSRDILPPGVPVFEMTLSGTTFVNLAEPSRTASASDLAGFPLHAVAAIGNPQRFFDHLRGLGLQFIEHAYPDHHAYTQEDLNFGTDASVIMTEKDAVKCERWNNPNFWVLPVQTQVDDALLGLVLKRTGNKNGR